MQDWVGEESIGMPKAAQVLAALKCDGWVHVRQKGSHRRLVKNGVEATFAFHDSKDMGRTDMAHVAKQFGYTLEELRRLL
jgi:predicted RNA binding protein YcfA (HicA-like mRNA interferase family)